MARKNQRDDLLTAAGPQILVALLTQPAAREPELRRECLAFLISCSPSPTQSWP